MISLHKITSWYCTKKALPYWCILLLDMLTMLLAGLLTYWIFIYKRKTSVDILLLIKTLCMYVLPTIVGARMFHTYSGIIRYSSFVDLMRVAYANIVSLIIGFPWHFVIYYAFPIGVFYHLHYRHIILMYIIGTAMMWAMRMTVKSVFEALSTDKKAYRVLIYGTVNGGIGLANSILSQHLRHYAIKGFIEPDKDYQENLLMGEKVYNPESDLQKVIKKRHIDAVLVPSQMIVDFRSRQQLQDQLIESGVKIFMAQQDTRELNDQDGELAESASNEVHLKEVSVEDLLPRDEINVDMVSIGELLKGRRVLVTGAAGSIGSEMVRLVAKYEPSLMVLIDQAETPEHDVRLMMKKTFPDIQAVTIVTSICKKDRMERIFDKYKPEYVFHAAAYKHVPMMEDNPSEAVQNNIYGTKVIADLADKYGVKKFVMISTDKAVNPTNVMGCSKRICEIYVQSLDKRSKTQYVTTRFGNVLGSNGSVIPLFREQIKNGGPVTVTHPDIIRYFMLIPEACKLVLEAGTKGNGGEIFVFDMGKPVRIDDLAKRMIKLSGAKNVKIEYTGLRDGEKLYEEVLNKQENTKPTFHKKIRIAEVRQYDYEEVCKEIEDLINISLQYDDMATVTKMKEIVPEYKSNNSIYEQLDA